NDYSIPIDTVLEKHFDVENLSYWLAFHILVGNVDTQSRNVYMYSPLNGTKWYFLSWDNDAMMKKQEYQIQNRVDATGWNVGVSNYWGNVLFQRALKSEKFRKELDKAVEDIKAYLSKEKITGLTQKYAAVVKPYLYSTADITYAPLTPSQFDLVARDMYKEVDLNYKLYKESFRTPQPFFIALPRKMADGKMIYEWEASYDFNGEPITYTFELGTDYLFARPILEKEGMTIPVVEGEKLSPGHYFVRVTAKNKSGKTQTAFDCYTVENGKVYGVLSFYVRPDGKIEGEVYED
ncbi:MAG: CotH kinase family protein, partial [Clostridia bacterium]|nr:CotH kinase family protein [Clostridia bacterium]